MNLSIKVDYMNTDVEQLSRNWGNSAMCLDHPWVDTSLLPSSISELESILHSVPKNKVYVRIPGNTPDVNKLPIETGTPGELQQRLQEGPLHVLGNNLHKVSIPFQEFLNAFLEKISPVLAHHGVKDSIEASVVVFLSSPNSIVPYHGDPEHNFLFHLFGTKKFHIFPNNDLKLYPSIYRDKLFRDREHIMPYNDDFQNKATTFNLKPGMATYQPPMAPHWVVAGDSIAVSLAISVFTSSEARLRRLHLINSYLRQLHIDPLAVGASPWRDNIKNAMATTVQKTIKKCRGRSSIGHYD